MCNINNNNNNNNENNRKTRRERGKAQIDGICNYCTNKKQ